MMKRERTLAYASVSAAGLTGAVLFWSRWLKPVPDEFSQMGHPWEPWFVAVHVWLSYLGVMALGWLLAVHVVPMRRITRSGEKPRKRKTGHALLTLWLSLLFSSLTLLTVAHEGTREVMEWAHVLGGGAFLVLFLWHRFWSASAA